MHELLQRGWVIGLLFPAGLGLGAGRDRRVQRIEDNDVLRMSLQKSLDSRAVVRDPDTRGDEVVEDCRDQSRGESTAPLILNDLGMTEDTP
ncbi:hypothetical protein [Kribbella sp. NPDC049584]|uniref:hypothetical protein n=1 Tax=Kribbella sp. NPDC049584 TaxID=3154833 RepID=UPI003419F626